MGLSEQGFLLYFLPVRCLARKQEGLDQLTLAANDKIGEPLEPFFGGTFGLVSSQRASRTSCSQEIFH